VIVEFSRRKFLLAAGGTTLALPVLEALTPSKALAAFENVRRMVFYITVNGSPRDSRPTGDGTGYTLGPIHQGLAKHRADMLFVAGLDSKAAMITAADPHATGFATTLSGFKCLPGDMFKHGACFNVPGPCASSGWGSGPSLDQLIGQQQLAAKVPVVYGALNFSVKNCPGSLYTRSSYAAPGMPVTPEADPSATFDRIFGMPAAGGMTDAATAARIKLRKTSALDELQAEITDLQSKLSAADKLRLDAHLTGLRDLELTLQRMDNQTDKNPACLPPMRPTLGAGNLVERNDGGMETNIAADKTDSLTNRHDIWEKLMIAAFACDLTRVITYITAPSRADTFMPWLAGDAAYPGNFTNPHHASSHANDKPTLTAMDHWYATRISGFVDTLKSTNDSEGKPLFERSAVAWFNELGEGPDHSHNDKPHTLVGSLGGFFKTGQLVRYPKGTPHNVLLTAIAQGMGVQTDHVGGPEPELQGGDVKLVTA
jgi:hypothetical protein